NEATLKMYYWTGTEWKLCNNTGVDPVNNIVWANVTELTIFAPMAEEIEAVQPINWLLYIGIIAIVIILVVAVVVIAHLKKK
ncbi:MAG: hypothetical protein QMC98_02300, partial [Candidatus Thermoplasmatota archaeon]|nr:hypothetical protein [Candidatus Thermoplasmatota archaeon]